MSITSTKSGATGISLALDNNYMEPIASVLVGSGGISTVTFIDIPQTYRHLQLRAFGIASYPTSGGGGQLFVNFNGDTGASYTRHDLTGNGTTIASNGFATGTYNYVSLQRFLYTSSASNSYGASVLDILDYTNTTKNKTTKLLGGFDNNGSGEIYFSSALWVNKAAITKIDITPIAGNLIKQYSRFSLYGIKG